MRFFHDLRYVQNQRGFSRIVENVVRGGEFQACCGSELANTILKYRPWSAGGAKRFDVPPTATAQGAAHPSVWAAAFYVENSTTGLPYPS